jgi:amidophosphoribosyltransferase
VASDLLIQQVANYLGADSLGYLSLEALTEAAAGGPQGLCTACFTGNYPSRCRLAAGHDAAGMHRSCCAGGQAAVGAARPLGRRQREGEAAGLSYRCVPTGGNSGDALASGHRARRAALTMTSAPC